MSSIAHLIEKLKNNYNLQSAKDIINENPKLLMHALIQDLEMCKNAVKIDPYLLKYAEFQDLNMCKEVIDILPFYIEYAKYQDLEMCKKAINSSLHNMQFVKLKDHELYELYEITIKKYHYIDVISKFKITDYTLCKKSVEINPSSLKSVENQDLEMCKIAVNKEPRLINYAKFQDLEMCKGVLFKDINLGVRIKHWDLEMCKYMYSKNPLSFSMLKFHDFDMVMNVIKNYTGAYKLSKLKNEYLDLYYFKILSGELNNLRYISINKKFKYENNKIHNELINFCEESKSDDILIYYHKVFCEIIMRNNKLIDLKNPYSVNFDNKITCVNSSVDNQNIYHILLCLNIFDNEPYNKMYDNSNSNKITFKFILPNF